MRTTLPGVTAIVLGAAVWPGATPSPALRRRAEVAAQLYCDGLVKVIITTGGVGDHPPSEAAVTARVLTELGVPESAIRCEDRSHSTMENLVHSRAFLADGAPVVIVTDRWHLPRAKLVARRLGLVATGAAPSLRGSHPGRITRAVLRELPALLWYAIRPFPGTAGAIRRQNCGKR